MAENKIILKEVLEIDSFNPLNIDVTEFEELSKSMPRDANIDLYTAEKLSSQYLQAANRCSEILSTLIAIEGKAKSKKGAVHGRLFLQARDEGHRTVQDKKAYVESHEEFLGIEEKLADVFATRKYFEMKHDFFLKSHQMMKEKVRGEQRLFNSSGYSESNGTKDNGFGEQDWK